MKYTAIPNQMIGSSVDADRVFWGKGGYIPSIDYMDEEFHRQEFQYSVCPVRFNIGVILMYRTIWDFMDGWRMPEEGNAMRIDEDQANQNAIMYSMAIIISENTLVGHLSFGQQNEGIRSYHASHRKRFLAP